MLISLEQEALIGQVFETYLTEHHREDILQLIADTSEEIHRPVFVNAMTLFEASMEVADYFNAYPGDVLTIFDKVLHRMLLELSKNESSKRTKEHIMRHIPHTRITGLPVCPEMTRDTIPRSRDVGHFLSVTGTVIRTSVAKVLEYERDYMCTKCRHVFTKQADFDQFYVFAQLTHCPNPDGCNSIKFSSLSGGSEPAACKDYQEIKIQEQVQRLSVGSIPRSVLVVLEDDLVDSCKSGDDVTVYGVMCQRWKPFYDGTPCTVELVLRANNIEVNNQQAAASLAMKDVQKEFEDFWNSYKQDPIAGRNHILLNLCPQVFGMYLIKLAVALVLAGGVQRIDSSGTKIRGECHLLLVGDPGTGKSQFLKYAAKIMPRSVLTAGIGSTSAGLTVAAVKDGVDWHLEAGALVLADGGLCCIDEFNSIKEHDRISIHEAMEQQSISVAKAGMVCKLNTRTSILAATNPKGQYDPNQPLSVNVALASPLLSRFDLVLVLMDNRNPEWDRVISSFILEGRGLCADSASLWTMEKIKAYFRVIKRLQPQMSAEANSILTRYYQLQRQSDGRNTARTTIRMLESLSRLAEAHSRLMYRETVTIEDAVMAVSVMECSMQGGALLGNVNALFTTFPADPREQYKTQCQLLLEGLNLPVLLQKELDRLARLKSKPSDASSPPAENCRHSQRDTTPITKTDHHGLRSNCRGDGLDWFHSISSSLSPDGVASPVITSTQQPVNRKLNSVWSEITAANKVPSCRSVKDVLSSTDSAGNSDIVEDPFGTIVSPSEDQPNEKDMGEENLETEEAMKQCERWKDKNHPESLHVFQKVSRNMRDKRFKELKHLQCAEEHHGRPKESRLAKKVKRGPTESEDFCAMPQEERTAEIETRKELHDKLSGFKFKPRKMRATVCHDDTNTQTESPRSTRLDTENRTNKKKPTGVESDTERGHRQSQLVVSSGSRSNQASSSSQVGDRTPVEPDTTRIAFGHGVKIPDNLESQSHDKVNNFTCVQKIPEACKRGPDKPTVSSSTLSKLSKFSFVCTNPLKGVHVENAGDMQGEPTGPPALQGASSQSMNDDATDLQNTVNVNKRKCFELGPVCSRGPLSGLFSSVEVGNDVLDTDWDQEVSKKFKI